MKGVGGGPQPKPADQRRRKNPVTKETITIPASAKVAKIPKPSLPFDGIRAAIWKQIWSQPVATLWELGDVASLTRMVMLQTTPATFANQGLLAETRQLEDRFLLNPYARAQQRVVIVDDEGEAPDGETVWLDDARQRLRGAG